MTHTQTHTHTQKKNKTVGREKRFKCRRRWRNSETWASRSGRGARRVRPVPVSVTIPMVILGVVSFIVGLTKDVGAENYDGGGREREKARQEANNEARTAGLGIYGTLLTLAGMLLTVSRWAPATLRSPSAAVYDPVAGPSVEATVGVGVPVGHVRHPRRHGWHCLRPRTAFRRARCSWSPAPPRLAYRSSCCWSTCCSCGDRGARPRLPPSRRRRRPRR